MHQTKSAVLSCGSMAALLLSQQSAYAQQSDNSEPVLEQIVVTAERRDVSVQDAPLAISAFSGDALIDRHVASFESLASLVPNLNFGKYGGVAQIAIRGVSFDTTAPGAEARAALYDDGFYVSRPSAGLAGFFDVERIEVLRGPQGTLYGRNATAGAINVITRDPTDTLEGFGRITVGNYDTIESEAGVGGPITDSLSGRLAIQTLDHEGWATNLSSGNEVDAERTRSVRGKVLYEPIDELSLKLTANYSNRNSTETRKILGRGRPEATTLEERLGRPLGMDPRDVMGPDPIGEIETYSFALEGNYDLTPQLKLTSLTGHLQTDLLQVNGFLASRQRRSEDSQQFSQELRLTGDFERVSVIVGGYYFREDIDGFVFTNQVLTVGGPWIYGSDFGGRIETDAFALFSQVDVRLTSDLTLTLGARYSDETKSANEFSGRITTPYAGSIHDGPRVPFPRSYQEQGWTSFDPKLTVTYLPTDDLTLYATYSSGFKSGGFNLGGLQAPFDAEELTNYELGVKSELLSRRLRINLAGFYYQYENLQVQQIIDTRVAVQNAADSSIKGIEIEARMRPIEALDIGLNAAFLDARFDSFVTAEPSFPELGAYSLAGNTLVQSPDYNITFDGAYTIPTSLWGGGEVVLRADVTWKDRIWFTPYNREAASQQAYALANASVTYDSDSNWSISAFVRNVSDEQYRVFAAIGPANQGYPLGGALGNPRTYGLSLMREF